MMYGMNLLFAQRERKEIGSRTKRGLEEAVRQGKYPTRVPFGYKRNLDGKLEIDPVSSIVVKDIFELYASGLKMNAIAKKFNLEGRLNSKNNKWRDDKILKIISNPIYKGEIHWRRTTSKNKTNPMIVIPNHSPKIVSEELYDRCMEQLNKNKHGGYGEHIHIFQSIIKCPYCDKMMSNYFTIKKRASGDKEFYYVICKNQTCKGKGKIYNTEKIETALIKLLNAITSDYKNDKYSLVLPYQEKNMELDNINKAIDKLKKDEQKLLDLYLQSSINIEIINKKSENIQKEISNLEIKKAKYEKNIIQEENISLKEAFKKKEESNLLGIDNLWNVLSREEKKSIINMYIKQIEIITHENYQIAIKNIIFQKDFIKDGINYLTEVALSCIKENNENIIIKKPIMKNKLKDNSLISIFDSIKNKTKTISLFWQNIVENNSTLYPIYDSNNVLIDIKVKVNPIS